MTAPSRGTIEPPPDDDLRALVLRHLRFGWWSLAVFLSLGIVLEGFHGFKVAWYWEGGGPAAPGTRRLMFTLAHAHGTLLSLVHVAFAASLPLLRPAAGRLRRLASSCLCGAGIALPCGFFLGGVHLYGDDPGLGILLVPVGALLLLIGVAAAARCLRPS